MQVQDLVSKENPRGRYARKYFQNGELKINNYEDACENADKILRVAPMFPKYNSNVFVTTMIGLFKKPAYDHDEFLMKLSMNSTVLQPCINVSQYMILIEEIYNFKRRNKINLRLFTRKFWSISI